MGNLVHTLKMIRKDAKLKSKSKIHIWQATITFKLHSLHHVARDLHSRVEETKKNHPTLKRFLLGTSLGGLIATLMVKEYPNSVDALILTSPAFRVHENTAKWYLILG